jgi:hypothetical protein
MKDLKALFLSASTEQFVPTESKWDTLGSFTVPSSSMNVETYEFDGKTLSVIKLNTKHNANIAKGNEIKAYVSAHAKGNWTREAAVDYVTKEEEVEFVFLQHKNKTNEDGTPWSCVRPVIFA